MTDRQQLAEILSKPNWKPKAAAGVKTLELSGFKVYYPATLTGGHPILSWGNPSFFDSWVFSGLLNFLAADGFVIAANHSTWVGSGKEILAGVDLLAKQNADSKSPFYGKLAADKIGVLGHSQGGGGAAKASADPRVLASAPLCPWSGAAKCSHSQFVVACEKDGACPPTTVERQCVTSAKAETYYAILKGGSHYTPVSILGGSKTLNSYVLEFFRWKLKGTSPAAFEKLQNDAAWTVKRWG